jgi:ABC-2 type transport system ATP-binding protein
MEAIRCEGLGRKYGQVDALVDLNLTISAGTVFGYLGKNGAGKTTTIRLMTGLAKPTTGRCWIDGVSYHGNGSDIRNRFGYLPEEPAFYTWMKPAEFLRYVGRIYRLESGYLDRRIPELLDMVDLLDASNRRIGGFSRGMRQRLGFAQALIHNPGVLFLDEPTSALDPTGRRSVLDLIGRMGGDTTIFLSSHILTDVEQVCDQIGVIDSGKLLLVANREELTERYSSNVFVLEVDPSGQVLLDDFVDLLRSKRWVESLSVAGNKIRGTVRDIHEAKLLLLQEAAQSNLILDRYSWEKPTLEEIFLRIS